MSDLLKVALFVAALWAVDEWRDVSQKTDDFSQCDRQAAEAIAEQRGNAAVAFLLPPSLNTHDQIDELIQRCMTARDYDYVPDGWKRCPTEKLPACYHKPSWATRVYREIRDLIFPRA